MQDLCDYLDQHARLVRGKLHAPQAPVRKSLSAQLYAFGKTCHDLWRREAEIAAQPYHDPNAPCFSLTRNLHVASCGMPDKDRFLELTEKWSGDRAPPFDPFDADGCNYSAIKAWLGNEDRAFRFIGLAALLNLAEVQTPREHFPGMNVSEVFETEMLTRMDLPFFPRPGVSLARWRAAPLILAAG